MNYETLTLKKGKDKALDRQHPWIFSGAFKNIPTHITEGTIVYVEDFQGNFKAVGFFQYGTISVKVFSFIKPDNIEAHITQSIKKAIAYREHMGLLQSKNTNCYRLVYAEGDLLPDLIIDQYNTTAVIQFHSIAWKPFLNLIRGILLEHTAVTDVLSRPSSKIKDIQNQWLTKNQTDKGLVLENGHHFKIDWSQGQKTGFFIDQRENRQKLGELAKGKSILNTFSYTGGFSVYALANGATEVVSVDISQSAIDLANENVALNGFTQNHKGIAEDVFDFLKREAASFDIIVLDPPAFSKNKRSMHNAVQAYKRLNEMAIRKIKKGGIIFTFSCSQHIDAPLFENTIRAAAIEAQREVRIVQRLSQPSDHPVNIFHPEGAYLKGLILYVD